jgi:hypothetical protein
MTEAEYRALEIDSYSSLKVFIEDRRKYYRRFVLREPVRDEDTASTIFGSLVDCLQFTPGEFEERYSLAVSQVPTGQYGKFIDELMKVTLRSLDESGTVTRDLEDMMEDAYKAVKFDRSGNIVDFKRDSFEVVKGKFLGSDLEMRYRELRDSHGKTVVELKDVENATAIVNELKNNFVTKAVMSLVTNERFEVYNQFPIIGDIWGYPMKCLVDRLIIDTHKKEIFIIDLKTAWDNEGEFVNNYFKYKYYIQTGIYHTLVDQWRFNNLKEYRLNLPKFVVAESNNYKNPLIYEITEEVYQQAIDGFKIRGKYYPGVIKAIEDLKWHKETGIWSISKDNYMNKGRVKLSPFE